jgi:tripartite-type tricarboxylate transporter receptor subunit TctC
MKKLLPILFLFLTTQAFSQAHTLKLIMSSGPGSGSDVTVETYAPCFKKNNFVILKDFRPGAEGLIAAKYLTQQQDTDKVTHVLVGNFGMSALTKFPNFNMLEDVNPITYLNQIHLAFVTKAGGPSSIEDLIKISQQRPINVGVSAASSIFLSDKLFKTLNVNYQNISYKNNTSSLVDVLNGSIDVAIDTYISAKRFTDTEKAQIIISTLNKKDAATNKHKSIEHYDSTLSRMPLGIILSMNPDANKESKNNLAKLVNLCNNDREIIDKLEKMGSNPVNLTTDEIVHLIKSAAK